VVEPSHCKYHELTLAEDYVARLRLVELRRALDWLPPGRRILEIGAGAGWQARELSRMGHQVEAIDLAESTYAHNRIWPIRDYDGRRLPFPAESFDVVFSSNVMEHVENFDELLREQRRVLKNGGYIVHVVPSATWRIWTILAYFPDLLRRAMRVLMRRFASRGTRRRARPGGISPSEGCIEAPTERRTVMRALWPPVHGVRGTAVGELLLFRSAQWARVFEKSGMRHIRHWPAGIFYSGQILFGDRLPMGVRRSLARALGSSCHVFQMRAAEDPPPNAGDRVPVAAAQMNTPEYRAQLITPQGDPIVSSPAAEADRFQNQDLGREGMFRNKIRDTAN
jgi:SAM-dependent methyltransferase